MTAQEQHLREMLGRRHVSPAIIDRVVRLNPQHVRGQNLRGIHYKPNPRWLSGWYGKGEFIAKHGAEAWARIPKACKHKQGRREFVSREAVQDQVWLHG